eukprot:m.17426 g.17426  ORF g.17426 m.17426 type:complete len:199 (-) comp10671_c0_seq1:33-629(-)
MRLTKSALLCLYSMLACFALLSVLDTSVEAIANDQERLTLGAALMSFATRIDTKLYNRMAASATALALEVGTGSGSKDQGGTAVLAVELSKDEVIRVTTQVSDNLGRFLQGTAKAIGVTAGPVYVHLYCPKTPSQQQSWQQRQNAKLPKLRCEGPVQLLVTVSASPLTPEVAAAVTVNALTLNHYTWLLPPDKFFQAL